MVNRSLSFPFTVSLGHSLLGMHLTKNKNAFAECSFIRIRMNNNNNNNKTNKNTNFTGTFLCILILMTTPRAEVYGGVSNLMNLWLRYYERQKSFFGDLFALRMPLHFTHTHRNSSTRYAHVLRFDAIASICTRHENSWSNQVAMKPYQRINKIARSRKHKRTIVVEQSTTKRKNIF